MLEHKVLAEATLGLGEAGIIALLGYAVVFIGLVLLMLVVVAAGKGMARKKAEPPVQTAPAAPAPVETAPAKAPEAKGTGGTMLLHDVSEREAAMVMAVVAHQLNKPLNRLRFKSIREVKEK